MSDQQVLEWLESEVGYMENLVPVIEDGDADIDETAGLIGAIAEDIPELRHAVFVD